jgi:hypothetical protein
MFYVIFAVLVSGLIRPLTLLLTKGGLYNMKEVKTIDDKEFTRVINEVVSIAKEKASKKNYFLISVSVITETLKADVLTSKPFTSDQVNHIESAINLADQSFKVGNSSIIKDGAAYLSITMEVSVNEERNTDCN